MREADRAQALMAAWCGRLGIVQAPRLVIEAELPGCLGVAEYDGSQSPVWTVRLRRGLRTDMERVLVHELLHVRTGLTDPCHEAWIDDLARALVRKQT